MRIYRVLISAFFQIHTDLLAICLTMPERFAESEPLFWSNSSANWVRRSQSRPISNFSLPCAYLTLNLLPYVFLFHSKLCFRICFNSRRCNFTFFSKRKKAEIICGDSFDFWSAAIFRRITMARIA